MRYVRPIVNIFMPTLIFYMVYKLLGILPAVVLSLLINVVLLIADYAKRKTVSNSQIMGIVGGILSALAIWGGGSEKWTFVPALIQNVVMLAFFAVLTLKRRSILKYILADFQVKAFENVKEENLLTVNVVWVVFFTLKIIAKILGILMLDYDSLYWVVFFMGDPAFIVAVIISILMIRRSKEKD